MSKDKQIADIKQVLIRTCKKVRTNEQDFMQDRYAEELYKADYRKASDVAAKIFADINALIDKYMNSSTYSLGDLVYDIAELSENYTESEKDK